MSSRSVKYSVASVFVVAALIVTAGCARYSRGDSKIFSVFSDFVFVGEGAYQFPPQPGREVTSEVIEHGQTRLPLPERPEIGRQYVFHHNLPLDVEKLALADLPSRLQREGFQILTTPHSSQDMMRLYFGGPVFVIKFKQGNHVGFIFDRLCPKFKDQVNKGWDANDYVVVFER